MAASAYPPPNNPNVVYPPPNNPNGVYPPSANDHNSDYPPPSTNSYGGGGGSRHPPGSHWSGSAGYHASNAGSNRGETATGYPYVAPFYQPSQQPYYSAGPIYTNGRRGNFLRRLCSILIILFIIAGTVIFIVWLVLRPRLPEFRVDSLSVNNFTIDGNSISGTWDVSLTAKNPNSKVSILYEKPQAGVFYRHTSLAETSLQPFDQHKKNETSLTASFSATNLPVDPEVVDAMKSERDKLGTVEFNIRMVAPMGFEAGIWKPRRRRLKVFCGDLLVSLPSKRGVNGSLMQGPKQCRVGF